MYTAQNYNANMLYICSVIATLYYSHQDYLKFAYMNWVFQNTCSASKTRTSLPETDRQTDRRKMEKMIHRSIFLPLSPNITKGC